MTEINFRIEHRLTNEQKLFIEENYSTMNTYDLAKIIGADIKKVRNYARNKKLKKDDKYKIFIESKNSKLTREQKIYILENYSNMETKEICKNLNIDEKTLRIYAQGKKLKKAPERKTTVRESILTLEQKQYIINNYGKEKTNKICKKLNITYKQLKGYVSNKGLNKEDYFYTRRCLESINDKTYDVYKYILNQKEERVDLSNKNFFKYEINEDYFEKIDSEFKAYWLGFLYADGYNSYNGTRGVLELGLAKTDESHLCKFKDSLQSTSVIHNKKSKIGNKEYESVKINICNKKLCEDLHNLGCVRNKSLILKFPKDNIVPKNLVRHFIRGYFDGDGCVHLNLETKHFSVSFVGTLEFLETIQKIISKDTGISKVSIRNKGKAYQIQWSGVRNCHILYKYLYKDCNIFLDRKFEKFNSLYRLD